MSQGNDKRISELVDEVRRNKEEKVMKEQREIQQTQMIIDRLNYLEQLSTYHEKYLLNSFDYFSYVSEKRLNKLKDKFATQSAQKDQKIKELENQVSQLFDQVDALTKMFNEHENDLDNLASESWKNASDISNMKMRIEYLQHQIEIIQDDIKEIQSSVRDKKKDDQNIYHCKQCLKMNVCFCCLSVAETLSIGGTTMCCECLISLNPWSEYDDDKCRGCGNTCTKVLQIQGLRKGIQSLCNNHSTDKESAYIKCCGATCLINFIKRMRQMKK